MIEAPSIYQIALPAMVAVFGGAGLIFAKIMGRRLDAQINQSKQEAQTSQASESEYAKIKAMAEAISSANATARAVEASGILGLTKRMSVSHTGWKPYSTIKPSPAVAEALRRLAEKDIPA